MQIDPQLRYSFVVGPLQFGQWGSVTPQFGEPARMRSRHWAYSRMGKVSPIPQYQARQVRLIQDWYDCRHIFFLRLDVRIVTKSEIPPLTKSENSVMQDRNTCGSNREYREVGPEPISNDGTRMGNVVCHRRKNTHHGTHATHIRCALWRVVVWTSSLPCLEIQISNTWRSFGLENLLRRNDMHSSCVSATVLGPRKINSMERQGSGTWNLEKGCSCDQLHLSFPPLCPGSFVLDSGDF